MLIGLWRAKLASRGIAERIAADKVAGICRSAVSNYPNGLFDVMMRLVDVLQRSQLQPLRKAIVLFMRDIVVGLVDQFKSAMQAARPVEPGIDGRVIVEILAVVNRSPLDLADGVVDLMDRFPFLFPQFSVSGAFQVGSGVPQIGQGVQICRMATLRETACGTQDNESRQGGCR
ncbi:MAG: hypothetical protein ABSG56_00635 [Bryobacteraceae bacterium]